MRLLITDPPIVRSWFVLIGCAFISAYVLIQARLGNGVTHAFNAQQICTGMFMGAYCGWSLYWGVPECWTVVRRLVHKGLAVGVAHGRLGSILTLSMLVCVIVVYPLCGGGVFHFLRRWWTASTS
jgi:hypothetical protein